MKIIYREGGYLLTRNIYGNRIDFEEGYAVFDDRKVKIENIVKIEDDENTRI